MKRKVKYEPLKPIVQWLRPTDNKKRRIKKEDLEKEKIDKEKVWEKDF